uniref:ATP synthase F0 subunit 8 n=1 Tax=Andrena haemorrhoa TaxID=444401 RepID=A0A0S2LTB4_9HYME|nr:ATP synthase F0 subunit 8 [Andrena haemorrhoa]
MPQMKPLMWTVMMMMTMTMIITTMILNFFTNMKSINQLKKNKIKSLKWKW